jgi:hypothetical protein
VFGLSSAPNTGEQDMEMIGYILVGLMAGMAMGMYMLGIICAGWWILEKLYYAQISHMG